VVVLGVQSMLAKVTHWYRILCFQVFFFSLWFCAFECEYWWCCEFGGTE
jgi:hypothetical protein